MTIGQEVESWFARPITRGNAALVGLGAGLAALGGWLLGHDRHDGADVVVEHGPGSVIQGSRRRR